MLHRKNSGNAQPAARGAQRKRPQGPQNSLRGSITSQSRHSLALLPLHARVVVFGEALLHFRFRSIKQQRAGGTPGLQVTVRVRALEPKQLYINTSVRNADLPGYMQSRQSKERDLVVVVVGPRTITNKVAVWGVLDRAHRHKPISTIVHGGTLGVELLAGEWASRLGLRVEICRPDWLRDEEIAILQRNRRMVEEHRPDGVIVFPGAIFGEDLAAHAGASRIAVWRPRVSHR